MPIELARLEHTILRPQLLPPQVHREVSEAMRLGLAGLVVAPAWIGRIATMLRESALRLCATVAFPHGTSKSTIKAIEATSCLKDGAHGLWVVPHLPHLIRQDLDAMKFELLEIARAARATRPQVMMDLVIDIDLLTTANGAELEPSLVTACRAARESGFDGIVCGTGITGLERGIESVKMMRQYSDSLRLVVNVMGDLDSARSLLDVGADRVASDRAVELLAKDVT